MAIRVLGGSDDVPARANIAIRETSAEMIPIREREKTRAAKSTAATKIQSAKKGNSVLERIFFMRFSSSGAFRRKVQVFCKAMTTAKGRIISSSPA